MKHLSKATQIGIHPDRFNSLETVKSLCGQRINIIQSTGMIEEDTCSKCVKIARSANTKALIAGFDALWFDPIK